MARSNSILARRPRDRDTLPIPAGFHNNYEFVVQISVFGLADNLARRWTLPPVRVATLHRILCIRVASPRGVSPGGGRRRRRKRCKHEGKGEEGGRGRRFEGGGVGV